MAPSRRGASVLGRSIQHVLVDLDDTLYDVPEIANAVRAAITAYMVAKLDVPADEAPALTQRLYLSHGTTLAGLAASGHALDFDDWHAAVHGCLNYPSLLQRQPATRRALAALLPAAHVLTNADAGHTAACLGALGLADCFQSIWCFENIMEHAARQGLLTRMRPVLCKPNKQVFELVLAQLGCVPANAMFIDDSPRNTAAARELGLLTVLVSPAVASQQQQQQPPCADLVVPSFEALQAALPQLFECSEQRVSSPAAGEAAEELPTGVPVPVMAS